MVSQVEQVTHAPGIRPFLHGPTLGCGWNAAVTTKLSVTDTLNQDKDVLHQQLFLTVNTVEQFTDVVKLNMYVCMYVHTYTTVPIVTYRTCVTDMECVFLSICPEIMFIFPYLKQLLDAMW